MSLEKPPSITRNEFEQRRKQAAEDASARGLDALLVWSVGGSRVDSFADVFYLTNHYSTESRCHDVRPLMTGFGHAAVVVPVDGEPALLVHKPDWRTDLVAIDEVESDHDLYRLVVASLRAKGLERARIGLVREDFVPLPLYRELCEEFPEAEFVSGGDVLEHRRMVKSPAEIKHMRHASAVSVEIMNAMFAAAEVGNTDGDLATIGFKRATELGATPWDFAMASGPHSTHVWWGRLPSFDAKRKYAKGDIIHPDVYGCVDGYFYDFVRSIIVGRSPTDDQLALVEAGISLIHHVCEQIGPGVRASDIYESSIAWIGEQGWLDESSGVTPTMTPLPFLAHGIGLGWEGPWISADNETTFEPGMTVAVETTLSLNGEGSGYEETVLVTDDGYEIMTAACPARWW
ncbi:MAG: aminopeptidase P family protein [Actinobacteria bacterium]|nr:aminopeptidase P family protein [Actinomycetota bacterium]